MTTTEIAVLVRRQRSRQRELRATVALLELAAHPWLAAELHELAEALRGSISRRAAELDALLGGFDADDLAAVAARLER